MKMYAEVTNMASEENEAEGTPPCDCPVCGGWITWRHQKDNTWQGVCGGCRRAYSRDDDDKDDEHGN